MICPVCRNYFEENCYNHDCIELRIMMKEKKTRNEKTSAEIASLAAKGMKNPGSLTDEEKKKVFASALTQAADKCEEAGAEVEELINQ